MGERSPDSDSGSVTELEVGSEPPGLEGAAVLTIREGELVGGGQGPVQPDGKTPTVLGKRVQRVESSQHPGELAPKRMRNEAMGQNGQGKQQQSGGGRRQGGTGRRDWKEGTEQWQVEYARVQCGSRWCSAGCWQVHNQGSAVTSDTAG